MAERKIVVTGARSFAGNLLCDSLRAMPSVEPVPVHSAGRPGDAETSNAIVADLTQPLASPSSETIATADRVFHFAWDRSLDRDRCRERNMGMIKTLIDAMPDPARFIFISSPTAGPESPSAYGTAKYEAENYVRQRGGSVLVVGLITSSQAGTAYESIRKAVCGLPLKLYFDRGYRFYAVSPDSLIRACGYFLDDPPPGTYVSFPPEGQGARAFLKPIEQQCPRVRVPVYFHSRLALAILRLVRWAGLLNGPLGEKFSNFLYRDARRLTALPQAR